jgi:hypothetical protein
MPPGARLRHAKQVLSREDAGFLFVAGRAQVRSDNEKRRVFGQATTIDIIMEPPQLLVDAGARTGRMYFRKTYVTRGGKVDRVGEVLQELRWEKETDGWKIVSERDLRVIRQAQGQ